jgi:sugar lactone lactonase YvrE
MKTTAFVRRLASAVGVAIALPCVTVHATTMDTLYVSVDHATPTPTSLGLILAYNSAGISTTFASDISHPRGLAFDSAGNLFAASSDFETNQATIFKFSAGGGQSTFANTTGFISNVRIDKAGNLFATRLDETTPNRATTILKFTPGGASSTFASGFPASAGLAFDHAGNLYLADALDKTIFKFTPDGTRSIFVAPTAFASDLSPEGLAFDSAGNLFVTAISFTNANSDKILEFTPAGSESTFATGLNSLEGLTFDSLGNLFAAEVSNGDILKFTPQGNETVFASGLNGPHWLTFGPTGGHNVPDSDPTIALLGIAVLGLLCARRIAQVTSV